MLARENLFFVLSCLCTSSAFTRSSYRTWQQHRVRHQHRCQAHLLTTACEWLADRRCDRKGYQYLSWIEPTEEDSTSTNEMHGKRDSDRKSSSNSNCCNHDDMRVVPIYPLDAVFLPTGGRHTLNNVEPRNIKMAKDLMSSASPENPPVFCAVLRAVDTGRIARTGTLLRILRSEEQFVAGELTRIQLTCTAEETVQIHSIENPQAFATENRIRRSSEYLVGQVRALATPSESRSQVKDSACTTHFSQTINHYNMIRTIYQLEIGGEDFPPSTLARLGSGMSLWEDDTDIQNHEVFWKRAEEWQTVCNTIRQGKQALLSTDRNERMIEAATLKGGPLQLPIHCGDLDPEVQREIQLLEVKAQTEYVELELDPCLDFQVLTMIPDHGERVAFLSTMIQNERNRLEAVATETSSRKRS